jgi:hypothetical protein
MKCRTQSSRNNPKRILPQWPNCSAADEVEDALAPTEFDPSVHVPAPVLG